MRDHFSIAVRRALAARVAFQCSREDCGAVTAGPNSDPAKVLNIGVAAHITAASPKGPRYSSKLTREERRSITNAIWLCQDCAKLVDDDPMAFPVETLRRWKEAAELRSLFAIGRPTKSYGRGNLQVRTIRIQHAGFLFSDTPWPFRVDPQGEDATHSLNPPLDRDRYSTLFPTNSTQRIPSGNLFIDFTLENHDPSLIIVTSAVLEVLEVIPLPPSARMNWYLPDLEPHLYEVTVEPKLGEYSIFSSDTFKYGQFDADLFRVNVQLQEGTVEQIVRFRIVINGSRGSDSIRVLSDREYLLGPIISDNPEDQERATTNMGVCSIAGLKLLTIPFQMVVEAIANDDLSSAESCLTERITAFSQLQNSGMQMLFGGGPTLVDCLMIRVLVRLQLRKKKDAVSDLRNGLSKLNRKPSRSELKAVIEGAEACLRQGGNQYILDLIGTIIEDKEQSQKN